MRNDDILKAFLSDPEIQEKYKIEAKDFQTLRIGLNSDIPIVRTISIVIDKLENQAQSYNEIINYLNSTL